MIYFMKKLIICSLFISASAYGALPPYWHSVAKIKLVMDAASLQGSITKIEELESNMYRVETSICEAEVKLNIILPEDDFDGPVNYEAVVINKQCQN